MIPGRYLLTLTADDGSGAANGRKIASQPLIVNTKPVANGGTDRIASAGEATLYDATSSFDVDGKLTNYRWDFGDGSIENGVKVQHSYQKPGHYNAILTVTDDSNSPCPDGIDTIFVRSNNPPQPVILDRFESFAGGAHDEIIFDASASSDSIGDPITFS